MLPHGTNSSRRRHGTNTSGVQTSLCERLTVNMITHGYTNERSAILWYTVQLHRKGSMAKLQSSTLPKWEELKMGKTLGAGRLRCTLPLMRSTVVLGRSIRREYTLGCSADTQESRRLRTC